MKVITIIALILGVGGSLLYFILFKNRINYLTDKKSENK